MVPSAPLFGNLYQRMVALSVPTRGLRPLDSGFVSANSRPSAARQWFCQLCFVSHAYMFEIRFSKILVTRNSRKLNSEQLHFGVNRRAWIWNEYLELGSRTIPHLAQKELRTSGIPSAGASLELEYFH
ncbi:hypothetical protein Ddc_17288 [Ditylenchus destructor]|nr:hypothetical protein Ddc_17288 [Ditylenchus destructor]